MINVQQADFNVGEEYEALRNKIKNEGAIVTFTGLVRDFNHDGSVSGLEIEHYSGMTEKSLLAISDEARKRWSLGQIRIIHRIGRLKSCDQIVFVGVSSIHRKDSFEATEFIMDYLKTSAPFWKKEATPNGSQWVEAKKSDEHAFNRW